MNSPRARSLGASLLLLLLAQVSLAPASRCTAPHESGPGDETAGMVEVAHDAHAAGGHVDLGTKGHDVHEDGHEAPIPLCGVLTACGAAALPLVPTAQPSVSERLTAPFGGFVANPSSRVPALRTPPPKA